MVVPMMSIHLHDHPVESVLYRASFAATKPVSTNALDPSIMFYRYTVKDIVAFMRLFKPEGVTFTELQNHTADGLSPLQAEIQRFLTRDLNHFNRFARLYPDYDKLSAQDFRKAAGLAKQMQFSGNATPATSPVNVALPDTEQDVYSTRSPDSASPLQTPVLPATDSFLPRRVNTVDTQQETIEYPAVSPVVPRPAASPIGSLVTINSQSDNDPINPLENTNLRRANPMALGEPSERLKAIISQEHASQSIRRPQLLWTDHDASSRLDAAAPVLTSAFHADTPFEQLDYTESWQVSASKLSALLKHIDSHGEVTLAALRSYQAKTEEEAALLRYLRQLNVFQALAHLDAAHNNTLDFDDIKIMMDKHILVLTDAHLSVFIVN
jgi:hypothetical protein